MAFGKFSVSMPVELVESGGIPVRQVDTNGIALDDATDGYGVAIPVMPVDNTGANEDSSRIFSTWRKITLSPNGFPVVRVDVNGNAVDTSLGNISTPPSNLTIPVISGTLNQGDTLSTTNGTWANTPTSYTYQWKADGNPITGATASTYDLTASEVGSMITVTVTATNADGSASATSAAVGPVVEVVPTPSPVLTQTSPAGTNPMDWQGTYDGLILGRDTVRMEWRVNAGAWNQDTDHLVTSDDLLLGSWSWPLFDAATFAAADVVEVRERLIRDKGEVGESMSAWSNILSDTMAGAAPFLPSSLYGVGDVGYAWDTTDGTKIWQNNDGSVAGAFTSPVGRVEDISGLANHINSQNNTTRKPVWQNVANGMMKFDGSDDCMVVTPCLWAGGAGTVVIAVKGPSQDGVFLMGESNSAAGGAIWGPGLRSNINQDVLFYHRNDAFTATAVNKDINVFNDVTNVLAIVDDGSTVSLYVNGSVTPAATHNYTSRASLGTTTINQAHLGNVLNGGVDFDVSTSAYVGSGIVIDRALNGTELADAVQWVADQHGVTIP